MQLNRFEEIGQSRAIGKKTVRWYYNKAVDSWILSAEIGGSSRSGCFTETAKPRSFPLKYARKKEYVTWEEWRKSRQSLLGLPSVMPSALESTDYCLDGGRGVDVDHVAFL